MVSMTPVDRAIVKIGREQFDTAVIQAERLFLAAIGSTGRSEAFAQLLSEHESGIVRDQTVDAVKIPMQSVSVVLNNLAESAGYSALAAVEFTIPDWMIAKAKVTVDFDPNTTAMRQIISNEVSGMTTLLDASTADSLRIVLARGTQMSWTPDQMSRALKQTLGLDPRYTLAAENYRQGLINKGTKPGVVNKLTSEYTQRLRKNRAETIVRTEVQRVLVAAQEEAWSQAERNLGVRGNKVWLTAEDEMSCSICAPMHGAEANVGGVFSNGLNPPAHPNCRCAVSLRFPMPTTLKTAIKKGDKPGHPFRGNQWTKGGGAWHSKLEATFFDDKARDAEIAEYDALPGDQNVVVYHGTSAENAVNLERTGFVEYHPRGDQITDITRDRGSLYVAPTYIDADRYAGPGGQVVQITVPKAFVLPSSEARGKTAGWALYNSYAGAVIPAGARINVTDRLPGRMPPRRTS